MRAVAKQRGWEVVGGYADSGISGTERSRPALDRLVSDCKAGKVDVVVVWKLDRLARCVVHVCTLAESFSAWGVGLVSVRDANIGSTTQSGRTGEAGGTRAGLAPVFKACPPRSPRTTPS